jgi:hypothetical protein
MAEYGMMVQNIEIKPGMADAAPSEISQSLTVGLGQIVQKASKGLETFQGGGWAIVSHALTSVDRHLILTFLIHR